MRFHLVDRVLEVEPGLRLAAIKNVSMEASYFDQHFPGSPVFPGVLLTEALAQASGYLITRSVEHAQQKTVFAMMTAVNARFLRMALPGDSLRLETEIVLLEDQLARTRATASTEGEICARCDFTFGLVEIRDEPGRASSLQQWQTLKRTLERGALLP